PVNSVAFAPDGRRAVSVDQRGDVRIWDTANGRGIATLHADGELLQAAFSPDGSLVAAAGAKGEAIVWRWRSGERLADHHEPFGLLGASFDPDGRLVVLPGADGTIRLWDWRADRVGPILDAQGGVGRNAAFSRHGNLLAAGSDDGDVR